MVIFPIQEDEPFLSVFRSKHFQCQAFFPNRVWLQWWEYSKLKSTSLMPIETIQFEKDFFSNHVSIWTICAFMRFRPIQIQMYRCQEKMTKTSLSASMEKIHFWAREDNTQFRIEFGQFLWMWSPFWNIHQVVNVLDSWNSFYFLSNLSKKYLWKLLAKVQSWYHNPIA